MNKYEQIELELNKEVVGEEFHDSDMVNMVFLYDTLTIRLLLLGYLDRYGILDENDNDHYAVLEVKFEGINIKRMDLKDGIVLRDLSVLFFGEDIEDEDGVITLYLYDDFCNFYFNLKFTYNKYKWKIIDIITRDEYEDYIDEVSKFSDPFTNIGETKFPKWSEIKH